MLFDGFRVSGLFLRLSLIPLFTPKGIGVRENLECQQTSSNISKLSSNVIKCHQMSSNVSKCHQMSSNVIKCH